ncbi:hypothetical protein FA15DRAFT_757171 [Coprinopsis marcescibilis]|uniref:Uncharacterized protein n=1 Tax=Coprinopsis marcescibilis TaxID=230819 RepID=A0A5C3KSJ5_COPMA|nr:hypothetical protein FA15DRAFT_757171 [Coprinopsis marcescibilis]
MPESADFANAVQAVIVLNLIEGRIFNISVAPLELAFLVRRGTANTYGGIFYYNNLDDISGHVNQVGTTGVSDNRLAVRFRNKLALFLSTPLSAFSQFVFTETCSLGTDSVPDDPPPVDNAGQWLTWRTIDNRVVGKDVWQRKEAEVRDLTPPSPPSNLTSMTRWLQPAIRNSTSLQVRFLKSYLNAGRFVDTPDASLAPFTMRAFSGNSGQASATSNFAGGVTYQIDLDSRRTFTFSFGFGTSAPDSFKAGVALSDNPQTGFAAASDSGGVAQSDQYRALDDSGKPVLLIIRVTAVASQRPNFVIEEVRYYDA